MSDRLRITGLATGLDVDSIIKNSMRGYNIRLDKLKQDRQIVSWRQEAYRSILNDISSFRNTYLDILSPSDTNMLSSNNYAAFNVESKDNTIATASAGVGAMPGTYTVSFSNDGHLALSAKLSKKLTDADTKDSVLNPNIEGTKIISIEYTNSGKNEIVDIEITKDTKINELINTISTKTGGNVKANFSELTKNFTIETSNTGYNNSLRITDNTGIFHDTEDMVEYKGSDSLVYIKAPGESDFVKVEKSTNSFTIDGVTYNLLSDVKDGIKAETTITITSNPDKTFDNIKNFIDKYNELIDNINKQVDQKKQYTYKPLTDEQKKDMKEEEIKKWEDKAKEGLLSSDSNLQNLLYKMRSAFYESVKDSGISLSEAGLSTSSDTLERGKIILTKDSSGEYKLKNAIKNNPEKIANLFRKDSNISYDPDHKLDKDRYDEIGIFRRIDDILKDYTRTNRDSNGKKGILIEIAGIKGDLSEINSIISKQLRDNYDKRISELAKKIAVKEEEYYLKFSQLEIAMQKLNDQSNWLYQQLGLSGN